jgi:cell division control protein 6
VGLKARIFKDRFVFDESYRPRRLLVRDREASLLISRYMAKLDEMAGFTDVSLIYGSIGRVGIGKTTVATYVGRSLEELAGRRGVNFKHVYINTFGAPSLHQILSVIVDQLGMNISVRGSSAIEVLKAVVDHAYLRDMFILLVLDEFQSLLLSPKISEDDLYLLMRVYEEIPSRDGVNRISYLLVASDFRVTAYMRERIPQVESQIGFRMHLKPYTSDELKVILRQRAEEGLVEGVWDDYHIELISEYFGEDRGGDGSARKAILTLRMAAELAEAEGSSIIREDHVRRALSENALAYIPLDELRALSTHELLVMLALTSLVMEKGGWATTGELMDRYEEIARYYGEQPRGHTQFHTYIKNLTTMGLMDVRPSGKGVRGRTSIIRLSPEIPADRMREVLESIIMDRIKQRPQGNGA